MSSTLSLSPNELTSAAQAVSVGYAEGKELRANTLRKGIPEFDLVTEMKLREQQWPDERGHRCLHNEAWRRGFEAGFLGRPVPPASKLLGAPRRDT